MKALPAERFACPTGKARYAGRAEARAAVRSIKERARQTGSRARRAMEPMDFYRCGECEGWHLRSNRSGKRAA